VCAADNPARKSDCGSEPDNILITAAIARVKAETGQTWTPAQMIASYDDGSGKLWQHRWQYYLFLYYVKPMIEMHARHWLNMPLVVQLGNASEWHFGNAHCGASDPGSADCWSLPEKVADYVANTWGPRVWLKQNGLGNSSTTAYATLMGRYANKTRVTWEPGGTVPNAGYIDAAINLGKGSAICYQAGYIDQLPVPAPTQKPLLKSNYQAYYWPIVNK
jgi:hypothetical protein